MRTPAALAIAAMLLAGLTGCQDDGPSVLTPASPAASTTTTPTPTTPTPTTPTTTPTPATSAAPDLAGSRWNGTTSDGLAMTLHLLSSGQFDYTTAGEQRDTTPGNDGWTMTGSTLTLRPNGAFATYIGTVVGNRYTGSATNIRGKTWTFEFTRVS